MPIVRWLPRYQWSWLPKDLLAGLVVASVAIPIALGYAGVADAPVQVGLYALPGALLAYAIFGSSRQLSVGPSSTVALMSGSVVFGLVGSGSPAEAAALSAALALACGLILMLAGTVRLGWITDFMSKPVITGFTFGLALTVIVGELPHILGLPKEPNQFVPRLWATVQQLGETNPVTLGIGLFCLAVLIAGHRLAPRWPWALTLMVAGIALAPVLDLQSHDVEVIGPVPQGLPPLGVPQVDPSDLPTIALGGVALALVAVGEGLSAARLFAARGGYRISADQEFVGVGAANVAAGFSGGLSVCGSLSRTASAVSAGARSQISALAAMVAVLVVLVAFTDLLADLPRVVLSAVVVMSVWFLIAPRTMTRYRKVRRNDYVGAWTGLLGVVLLGPLYGLLAAVGISLLGLVYRSSKVRVDPLGRIPHERAGWGSLRGHPERRPVPGILVLRLDAPLFWVNCEDAHGLILAELDGAPGTRAVVLDLEATGQLDTTAVDVLHTLLVELRGMEVELVLARVLSRAELVMEKAGFVGLLGPDRIWHSISQAVAAACRLTGVPDEDAEDVPS